MQIHNAVITGSFSYNGADLSNVTSSNAYSASLSTRVSQIEQVYATTGSNSFRANQSITGSLTVTGQITAQTLNVQQVTSSIVYSSGSNVFGCDLNSRQVFTGSFYQTGSIANFSNIVCSYSTSTTYGYYNGSSTVLSNPTDKPHIFRLANGGLGISANNEGASSQPIVMYTCGQERLRIAANGYTGIGTNSPSANFEVCDNLINTPNLRLYSGYNSGTACNGIEFYRNYDANSNELGAYIKYLRVGGSSGDLLFATGPISGVANRLRIDYNGTVTFSCRICAPFIFVNGQAGNIGSDTGNGDGIELYGGNITGANCGIGLSMTRQGSQMGYIKAARENGTDEASYMIFSTQTAAGTHPERLRITSTGFVGINQGTPTGYFHVTSCGVTPTAPSWPIYNAETDSISRNIYVDTAGNGNCSTAGRGATVSLVMGGYWDSRVVITTPGAGSGSPSDQGQGRGKDMLIKAGTSDNTNGFKGGRLWLNGGMGFSGGAFNTCVGDIIMQGITGGGAVLVNTTTLLNSNAKFQTNGEFYMGNVAAGAGNSTLKYNSSTGLVSFDTSARIYKKDIVDLEYGLDAVLRLSSKKYKWKLNDAEDLGFIADEMYQVIPEVVYTACNRINETELVDGEPMGINYDRLVPVLVKAIQEQQCTISSQISRIDLLESCLGIS